MPFIVLLNLGQFFLSHDYCQSHNVSDWLVWWCVWLLLEKVSSRFTEAQCPMYALTCSNTLWLCARLLIWGDSVWWCLEPAPLPSNRMVVLRLWLACVTLTNWKYCLSKNAEGTSIHIFQKEGTYVLKNLRQIIFLWQSWQPRRKSQNVLYWTSNIKVSSEGSETEKPG